MSKQDCYTADMGPGQVAQAAADEQKASLCSPNKLVIGTLAEILIDTGRKRFIRLWTH